MSDESRALDLGYLPWSLKELEELVRRLIDQSVEGTKVDFKERFSLAGKAEQVAFAKDVSAIANSDHEACRDYGFIILGARRGELVAGLEDAHPDRCDHLNASMTGILKEYLSPTPIVYLIGFVDADHGPWGVVVVPPSQSQPHLFQREHSGNPARGDWFIRLGDTTQRARPEDYVRVLEKSVSRAVRPLREELQEVTLRVRALEDRQPSLQSILEAVHQPPGSSGTPQSVEPLSGVARVRSLLRSPIEDVRELLELEALTLRRVLREEHPDLVWTFSPRSREAAVAALTHLEKAARPLVEMLATVVRFDANGQHADALARAFALLAREPTAPGTSTRVSCQLRLYPIALALQMLVALALHERRVSHLSRVLDLTFERGVNHDESVPFALFLRDLWGTSAVFDMALGGNQCEPVGERLNQTTVHWLGEMAVPDAETLGLQAGFVLALVFAQGLRRLGNPHEPPFVLPGAYLYQYRATGSVKRLLRNPALLEELFGSDILTLLNVFDTTAPTVVNRLCSGSGFVSGAQGLFEAGRPSKVGA